jgi:hypothetical protein
MKITTLVVDSDDDFTVAIYPDRAAAVAAARESFDEDQFAEYDEASREQDHFTIDSTVVNITEHDTGMTKAQISEAFISSEEYAAGRMTHAILVHQKFNQVQSEVVHDALMAGFQAGYLAAAAGTSVDELLARMAELA